MDLARYGIMGLVLILGLIVAGAFLLWFWRKRQRLDALEILHEMGGSARGPELRDKMEQNMATNVGTFYMIMDQLEEYEFVTSREESGGQERNFFPVRIYTLTDRGRELVTDEEAESGTIH